MKRRSFLSLLGLAPAAASLSHAVGAQPTASAEPFVFRDGKAHLAPAKPVYSAITQAETLIPDYEGETRLQFVAAPEARGVAEVRLLTTDGRIVQRQWWTA
jgi:hypothetical protein